MSYVLEKLKPKYIEKIKRDLDVYIKKSALYYWFGPTEDPTVAINADGSSYLLNFPFLREEGLELSFYFHYKENGYQFKLNFMYDNEINFIDLEPNDKEEREDFRNNLKNAFLAFGRFGTGPIEKIGGEQIHPEFKD